MLTLQAEVDRVGTQKSEPLFCLVYRPQEAPEAAKWHLVSFDPLIIPLSPLAIWITWRHSGGRGHQMGSGLRGTWREGLEERVCMYPLPSVTFGLDGIL